MKCLNYFLPKETLLDTTILLISIFVIEIAPFVGEIFVFGFQYHQFFKFFYMLSKNFTFFLIYNFQICSFKLEFEVNLQLKIALTEWFYNVQLYGCLVKSAFCIKFMASFLLINVIIL